ncbi:MFS transporter [Raineyella antarctica]|uniref:MFS transporter n=1 Tax=Raineyella antarctica TaxID=1577474 RepID=UPI00111470B1|nr:MFS transporter [Raineyella antarctica]
MDLWREGRRLMHGALFRKMLAVRLATQSADGILQMGLASYVVLSPVNQADAISIATVLAVTLLPFSIIGPIIGVVLDRWDRRTVIVVTDLVRAVLVGGLAVLVASGPLGSGQTVLFYGIVLVAMSLNRFLMANLQAAVPLAVHGRDFLIANSILPMVGPLGVVVGGAVAGGLRLGTAGLLPTWVADSLIFAVSATLFLGTVGLGTRVPPRAFGPTVVHRPRAGEVLGGMYRAVVHLARQRAAAVGLFFFAAQRVLFGMIFVEAILLYRNWFNPTDDIGAAMRDIGLWAGINGVGVLLSAAITPQVASRIGVGRWMALLLVGGGVLQIIPGSTFTLWGMLVGALAVGLQTQSMKISVDTLLHRHVQQAFKGRAFIISDMLFNGTLVVAAFLVVALAPADGHSVALFVSIGVTMILLGLVLLLLIRAGASSRGW